MATVTFNIGGRSNENVTITSVSGSGPYTVNLSGATSSTDNNDAFVDEGGNQYHITAGAGTATLTVADTEGVGAAPDDTTGGQAYTSRYFSTVTLWEADLDDTNQYSASDDAVGEGYNDSAFDESGITINGGGTVGLGSITLSVASGDRHDGTEGSGCRFVQTGSFHLETSVDTSGCPITVEWWEFDWNGQALSDKGAIFNTFNHGNSVTTCRYLIVHGALGSPGGSAYSVSMLYLYNGQSKHYNSILYDMGNDKTGTGQVNGIACDGSANTGKAVFNVTVHNIYNNNGTGACYGYFAQNINTSSHLAAKNIVITDTGGTTSGTIKDFVFDGSEDDEYNLSSDDSADDNSGTGALISKSATDQFVSTTGGSEDLHIKDQDADIYLAGTDLGATPSGVEIDIDGRDRDVNGGLWSIGADNGKWVKRTIGTSGRDYSTITLWEADLDTAAYVSGDEAIGEMYNDSAFGESPTINGGGTVGLSSITLTVASGERHDGTEGTGARIDNGLLGAAGSVDTTVEWIDVGNYTNNSTNSGINISASGNIARNCIVHDINASNENYKAQRGILGSSSTCYPINCIVYNVASDEGAGSGIIVYGATPVQNCTVYNTGVGSSGGDGIDYGICTNCISGGNDTSDFANAQAGTTYCMSEDDTADDGGGSNNTVSITIADQFVSTTGGSEDFHIKDQDADIYLSGSDLGTTRDVNIDIDGRDRDVNGGLWSIGADNGKWVKRTIGATGRDYSTITLWEADLDTAAYTAGDEAIGEGYNDSTFDETVTVNGGGSVGLSSATLKAASGEEHDGTAGSGVRIVRTGGGDVITLSGQSWYTVTGIEVDANGNSGAGFATSGVNSASGPTINRCIVQGLSVSDNHLKGIRAIEASMVLLNSIIYDCTSSHTGSGHMHGVELHPSNYNYRILNNTIHDMVNNGGTGACYGLSSGDGSNRHLRNLVITDTAGTTSGTVQDFETSSFSTATADYNAASDTSASGTGSLDSITTADQYVSTTGGSEDLHIKDQDADIYEAGTDLGTTPSGVELDIDGYDRDSNGVTWSIGADQGEAAPAGAGGVSIVYIAQRLAMTGVGR